MKNYKLNEHLLNTEDLLKNLIILKEFALRCGDHSISDNEIEFRQQQLLYAIVDFLTKPLEEIEQK